MTHEEAVAILEPVHVAERALKAAMRKLGEHHKLFFVTSFHIMGITIEMSRYYHEFEMALRAGEHD